MASFEDFCRQQFEQLVRFAYLITRDIEDAHDLAQEALVRAYERWGVVSDMEYPEKWVQRVLVNAALSWRRKGRRRLQILSRIAREHASPYSASGPSDSQYLLDQLTPAQRAVIVARFYMDLSVEQTAAMLGKQEGTVRALTWQGISRIRASWKVKGGSHVQS